MRRAKYIGIALLVYSLAFGSIYSTGFIHRQAYDRAFSTWFKNPTAENDAALNRERRVNEKIRLQDSTIGAAVLVAIGYGIWAMSGIVRRK
jgi:hypothetical protein